MDFYLIANVKVALIRIMECGWLETNLGQNGSAESPDSAVAPCGLHPLRDLYLLQ